MNLIYIKYINSKEWKIRRQIALEQANYKCQICGRSHELQVHHLSYKNLGNEKDEDLLVVCSRCHNDIEFTKRDNHCDIINILQTTNITETEYLQKGFL